MHNLSNKTVREIALDAPLTTRIFESYKIDYCCGGRIPFAEACLKAGANPSDVLAKIEAVLDGSGNESADLAEHKKPVELIDHIVSEHHVFTRNEIERLLPLADKVAKRHGDNHDELLEIQRVFQELADELLPHMMKEEAVLFPFIEKLAAADNGKGPVPIPPFGTVSNPIRMMCFEHDKAGDLLRTLRALSGDYTTPPDACPSFKGLFAGLEDLERDLHRHIHLENNVLFPQAIDLEKRLLAFA